MTSEGSWVEVSHEIRSKLSLWMSLVNETEWMTIKNEKQDVPEKEKNGIDIFTKGTTTEKICPSIVTLGVSFF